jgi:hypothetical protein
MPVQQFADAVLFKPLRMKNYVWTTADATGSVSGGWGCGCARSTWQSWEW